MLLYFSVIVWPLWFWWWFCLYHCVIVVRVLQWCMFLTKHSLTAVYQIRYVGNLHTVGLVVSLCVILYVTQVIYICCDFFLQQVVQYIYNKFVSCLKYRQTHV